VMSGLGIQRKFDIPTSAAPGSFIVLLKLPPPSPRTMPERTSPPWSAPLSRNDGAKA